MTVNLPPEIPSGTPEPKAPEEIAKEYFISFLDSSVKTYGREQVKEWLKEYAAQKE